MKLLILGLSCCILQAAVTEEAAPICVMTYNIHHGEGRDGKVDLDRIARIIRENNPDVVCLQEVDLNLPRTNHLDFGAELAKRLGMPTVFESNYAFDGGEYGNATLTRLEILSHENIALPNPDPTQVEPRGCLKTVLRTPAGPVQVFNTHLGLNADERKAQAEAILKHVWKAPTILTGDLNEGIAQPGASLLLTQFKDALTQGGVPAVQGAHVRIDHVLVSGEFDVLSSRIVSTPDTAIASDHLPYVAELSLDAKEDAAEKEGIYDTEDERVSDALKEGK